MENEQAQDKVIAINPGDIRLKLGQIRRNHALEHATLQLIAASGRQKARIAGYSDLGGFWLIGDIPTEVVEKYALGALERLRAGEKRLAIHPQCGTNYAMTALLGSFGVLLSLIGIRKDERSILDRLPLIWLALVFATFFGPIAGKKLQETITTDGDPGGISIGRVERLERGGLIIHRVHTRSEGIEGGLCRLIWIR